MNLNKHVNIVTKYFDYLLSFQHVHTCKNHNSEDDKFCYQLQFLQQEKKLSNKTKKYYLILKKFQTKKYYQEEHCQENQLERI